MFAAPARLPEAGMGPEAVDLTAVGREKALIRSLLNESAWPHPVEKVRLIDTHISWVLLTGEFAYKIKKPIKLEFLDFSTLENRRHFCEEELRLNRRWLPELYVGVVPICGSLEKPVVDGPGPAIEYALKMVQFPYSARLDQQLRARSLDHADMIQLAEMVAERHGSLPVCTDMGDADAERLVRHPMLENIVHLTPYLSKNELQPLADWTHRNIERHWDTVIERQRDGFVRECHGDLHLANLVRLPSGIAAFDCVEFNADLRSIDVISDVSFLVMDLVSRGREDFAYAFINRYLERSGDYAGMTVFSLYFVYHALIRAKILAIRSIERSTEAKRLDDLAEMRHFCDVARRWIERGRPRLILMHGFSGSGKTRLSGKLLTRLPAIRVRSDVERKRLFGLGESQPSESGLGEGLYTSRAKSSVYAALAETAQRLLRSDQHVIVDASFLGRDDRQRFSNLARLDNAEFVIVDTRAAPEELQRRLGARQSKSVDASEAGTDVLQYQLGLAEALDGEELANTVIVDTGFDADPDAVVQQILEKSSA